MRRVQYVVEECHGSRMLIKKPGLLLKKWVKTGVVWFLCVFLPHNRKMVIYG